MATVDSIRYERGTPQLRSSVLPVPLRGGIRIWWSGSASERKLALTFDDGPTERFTPQVLRTLHDHGAPATFFVIGELAERHPDLLKQVRDAGHELANHSQDHRSALVRTGPQIHEAMARGADTLERLGGARPRWYRPPRGEITSATLNAANDLEQDIALWSLARNGSDGGADDGDWAGVGVHLKNNVHAGAVVDLHDGIGRSALAGSPDGDLLTRRGAEMQVLPSVLRHWVDTGYEFVTLSELIPPT
jgi:peptidoglycan-N-acetylglucosamine deacetylase